MTTIPNAIVQPRRGTAAALTAQNPVLYPGEQILETDTKKSKTNTTTGNVAWNSITAYDLAGPKGDPGQNPYAYWLTLPGNAGKTLNDFFATFQGEDGEDGAPAAVLVGTTTPVGGVAANAIFIKVAP